MVNTEVSTKMDLKPLVFVFEYRYTTGLSKADLKWAYKQRESLKYGVLVLCGVTEQAKRAILTNLQNVSKKWFNNRCMAVYCDSVTDKLAFMESWDKQFNKPTPEPTWQFKKLEGTPNVNRIE